ncbi:lytic transglycosylase domain-containing protein [Bartonella henselae]|uniref:Soluble lytic murein transglycosylase n=1 Tax=Bartonella henselae (strain ATCC 49882 / DSM 28221 / CCUG 30454 / Houston 1) TaxID=283166 RepID=A0A0H3M567_BARHE|nr:lytic transglycosylase domain-containing protein [Bartonella henselae]ATP12107.1 lytic transglycosylase [Bartonella henselae]OLL39986.1 lytic transglycosylase [Bartonella henselae]OLL47268.1 lytic transglycosylase [Bartonella henselae]PNM38229.1 lytic transglycosylase [Bartonella henselae str. Houston-1]UAK84508.1 lytic transglycosylase domain-containing protein [Bartonella henselae]
MYAFFIFSFVSTFTALILEATILFSSACAQTTLLHRQIPIPLVRPTPFVIKKQATKPFRQIHTTPHNIPTFTNTSTLKKLKAGLDALSNNNIAKTISLRNSMEKDSLDRHILTWAIGISSKTNVPSSEIFNAIKELKGWPGIAAMQRNAERAFINETNFAPVIIQKFTHHLPLTAQGIATYAKALITTGQTARARQIIAPWWHKTKLNAQEEEFVLKNASAALQPIDHLKRMQFMLYAHRFDSAKRVAKLAHAQSLFKAFIAVEKSDPQAAQKLHSVERSWQKSPLLQFAYIRHLRRTGQYSEAATRMMRTPKNILRLMNPHALWREQRALSREMLDLNKPKIAYKLVATHTGMKASLTIDAEFHAGWYALRFLHNPQLAMQHFSRIPQLSSAPLSASRGYYWMGRTAEILGEHKNAQHYFHRAAHFSATYYGQLAASRLNQKKLEISFPKPTTSERQRFSARKAIQAIQHLESAGYSDFAKIFYRELGEKIESPGELALLAVMAEKNGDYYTSLKIGKTAVFQGKNVGALSHPLGAIPTSANISVAGKALIYAIARQESEFNPKAISKAGAQGILQLLPTTAKALAKKHSIAWSQKKFSSDASYNATLGAHFLREQLERFNGSYILALISYNAGPRRVNEWIKRYGDPRGQPLDKVIDWIERIPYTETRNYVMRIMENYGVYKARLTGKTDIKADLLSG